MLSVDLENGKLGTDDVTAEYIMETASVKGLEKYVMHCHENACANVVLHATVGANFV